MLLVSLLLLSACSNGKTQSLEEFYKDAKIENVDKVIIQDGSTGANKTITNQEQINEFLTLIKEIELTPQDNQRDAKGWLYGIILYDDEKEFLFTNQIDNIYYDSNPGIYPIVEHFYKNLEVKEE